MARTYTIPSFCSSLLICMYFLMCVVLCNFVLMLMFVDVRWCCVYIYWVVSLVLAIILSKLLLRFSLVLRLAYPTRTRWLGPSSCGRPRLFRTGGRWWEPNGRSNRGTVRSGRWACPACVLIHLFVTFKSQVYTYSLCFAEPSPCQTENGSEHLRTSELSFRSGILRISVIRAGIIRYDADVYLRIYIKNEGSKAKRKKVAQIHLLVQFIYI